MQLGINPVSSAVPFAVSEHSTDMAKAKVALAASNASVGKGEDRQSKMKQASQQFEAMFISEMLNHMFSGISVDPLFGGGEGEEMFRSFLVDEYGKLVSKAGGIGVSDAVAKQFLHKQEVHSHE